MLLAALFRACVQYINYWDEKNPIKSYFTLNTKVQSSWLTCTILCKHIPVVEWITFSVMIVMAVYWAMAHEFDSAILLPGCKWHCLPSWTHHVGVIMPRSEWDRLLQLLKWTFKWLIHYKKWKPINMNILWVIDTL